MRRTEDFRRTVRHGVRAGRRTVVVHALRAEPLDDRDDRPGAPVEEPSPTPLVGFVVSKAIGSAVHRNRVRRRLRHLTVPQLTVPSLSSLGGRTLVVIRALPQAATAGAELGSDLEAAWTAALGKLTGSTKLTGSMKPPGPTKLERR